MKKIPFISFVVNFRIWQILDLDASTQWLPLVNDIRGSLTSNVKQMACPVLYSGYYTHGNMPQHLKATCVKKTIEFQPFYSIALWQFGRDQTLHHRVYYFAPDARHLRAQLF